MEKETAEMFEHRRNEWLKKKKIFDADEPMPPSLRLDAFTRVILDQELNVHIEGIRFYYEEWSLDAEQQVDPKVDFHIDKKAAIDLAHFILELFGDKYSPG